MKKIENMKEIEIIKEYMEFGAFALILGIVNQETKQFLQQVQRLLWTCRNCWILTVVDKISKKK